jgi:CRISPR-associated endonuclease/helicase Cas3
LTVPAWIFRSGVAINQALLGAIQGKHAHMRSSSLHRHLLVVDEVHASDIHKERLLTLLLQHAARGHGLLLSPTLGSAARLRLFSRGESTLIPLENAERIAYPAISTSTDPTPRTHAGARRDKTVVGPGGEDRRSGDQAQSSAAPNDPDPGGPL